MPTVGPLTVSMALVPAGSEDPASEDSMRTRTVHPFWALKYPCCMCVPAPRGVHAPGWTRNFRSISIANEQISR